ncbi:hypothetical protein X279_06250 [Oenococcus oeni IOEB_0501]|nr:hypothetical protein X279_06250 [Oenococcus oeni IOEB_0501]
MVGVRGDSARGVETGVFLPVSSYLDTTIFQKDQ